MFLPWWVQTERIESGVTVVKRPTAYHYKEAYVGLFTLETVTESVEIVTTPEEAER